MNERIRKLAEQAKLQLDQDIKDGKKDWKTTPQSYDEMVQEKFAELIVKETLQVARAGIEFGDGMEDAVYKYFGVES